MNGHDRLNGEVGAVHETSWLGRQFQLGRDTVSEGHRGVLGKAVARGDRRGQGLRTCQTSQLDALAGEVGNTVCGLHGCGAANGNRGRTARGQGDGVCYVDGVVVFILDGDNRLSRPSGVVSQGVRDRNVQVMNRTVGESEVLSVNGQATTGLRERHAFRADRAMLAEASEGGHTGNGTNLGGAGKGARVDGYVD